MSIVGAFITCTKYYILITFSLLQYLEGDELVALLLEASDDLAHQVALHAVRLDHDVSALHGAANANATGTRAHVDIAHTAQSSSKRERVALSLSPSLCYKRTGTSRQHEGRGTSLPDRCHSRYDMITLYSGTQVLLVG